MLNTRYRIQIVSNDGFDYRFDVKQEGWAGGVIDITALDPGFRLWWGFQGRADYTLPVMPSQFELAVLNADDPAIVKIAEALSRCEPRDFPVFVQRRVHGTAAWSDFWRGYLVADAYEDNPFDIAGSVILRGTDGLMELDEVPAPPVTEPVSVQNYIISLLTKLHVEKLTLACRYYPWLMEKGEHVNPFTRLFLNPGVFEENLSARSALTRILFALQLKIVQWDGAWHILPAVPLFEDAAVDIWTGNLFEDLTRSTLPVWRSFLQPFRPGTTRTFTRRTKRLKLAFDAGETLQPLMPGTFETWSGGAPQGFLANFTNRITPVTTDPLQGNTSLGIVAASQHNEALVYFGGRVPTGRHLVTRLRFAEEFRGNPAAARYQVQVNGFMLTKRTLTLSGAAPRGKDVEVPVVTVPGTGGTKLLPTGTQLDFTTSTGTPVTVTLTRPMQAGDTRLFADVEASDDVTSLAAGRSATYYVWDTQTGFIEHTAGESRQVEIQCYMTTPGGLAVPHEPLEVRFYQPVGTGTLVIDDVRLEALDVDEERGTLVPLVAQICTSTSTASGIDRDVEPALIGDGLYAGRPRGFVAHDGLALRTDEPTGNWKIGPYQPGDSPSGRSLLEARARDLHRHFEYDPPVYEFEYVVRDESIAPFHRLGYRGTVGQLTTYMEMDAPSGMLRIESVEMLPFADADATAIAETWVGDVAAPAGQESRTLVISTTTTTGGSGGGSDWTQITGKPETATRWPRWTEVSEKPSTFTPSAHTHPWSEVTEKPSTFTPSAHSHPWSEVTGKPAEATRWPNWSEIGQRPTFFESWELLGGSGEASGESIGNGQSVRFTGSGAAQVTRNSRTINVHVPPAQAYNWQAGANSGTPRTIGANDSLSFVGGTGINTVVRDGAPGHEIEISIGSHTHQWSEITGKPSAFAPSAHTHGWTEITGKPSTFAPSAHTHGWGEITGKPAEATRWPTYAEVTNKPVFDNYEAWEIAAGGEASGEAIASGETLRIQGSGAATVSRNSRTVTINVPVAAAYSWTAYGGTGSVQVTSGMGLSFVGGTGISTAIVDQAPGHALEISLAAHTHAWGEITGKPTTFAPSAHSHAWSEITSKPTTFAPSAHTHAWGDISGAPATATRWPTWSEVTSKPSTFAPSAHSHTWSDVSGAPDTATRWPTWSEVTSKPSTFTPSAHTHAIADVTGLQTALNAKVDTSRTLQIQGTANQVSVSTSTAQSLASNRSWTLSLPQDIHSGASPAFSGLTIDGAATFSGNVTLGAAGTATNNAVRADRSLTLNVGNSLSRTGSATQNLTSNRSWTLDTVQDIRTSASPTFAGLTITGSATISDLDVIGTLSAREFRVQQIRATNGSLFVTDGAKLSRVTGTGPYLVDLSPDQLRVFQQHDLVIAQRVTPGAAGGDVTSQMVGRITNNGSWVTAEGVWRYGLEVLSGGPPEAGMELARFGNTQTAARQGGLFLTSSSSQYLEVFDGVTSYTNFTNGSRRKLRLGNLSGISDPLHGNLSGYGLWADNVYLRGRIEAVGGKIAGFAFNNKQLDAAGLTIKGGQSTSYVCVHGQNQSNDYVWMFNQGGSYGLSARVNNQEIFELGSAGNAIAGWSFTNNQLTAGDMQIRSSDRVFAVRKTVSGTPRDVVKIGDHTVTAAINTKANVSVTRASVSTPNYSGSWSGGTLNSVLGPGIEGGGMNDQVASARFTWGNLSGRLVRATVRVRTNHSVMMDLSLGHSITFMGQKWERLTSYANLTDYYDITYDSGWIIANGQTEMILSVLGAGLAAPCEGMAYTITFQAYPNNPQGFVEIAPGVFRLYDAAEGRGIFYENNELVIKATDLTLNGSPVLKWRGVFTNLNDANSTLINVMDGDTIKAGANRYVRDKGAWIVF